MTTVTGRAAADWRAAGACLHADPDLFFPVSTTGRVLEQIAKAKAVCVQCPVRQECLKFAQAHDPIHGIWGGTTPEDRQRARRREQRAARARARANAAVA
jgi:WhiB family redox-sensing transcriptional regulator